MLFVCHGEGGDESRAKSVSLRVFARDKRARRIECTRVSLAGACERECERGRPRVISRPHGKDVL